LTLLAAKFYSIKNSVDFFNLLIIFVLRNFRGICSSKEMLKGYMVRERLVGNPWFRITARPSFFSAFFEM